MTVGYVWQAPLHAAPLHGSMAKATATPSVCVQWSRRLPIVASLQYRQCLCRRIRVAVLFSHVSAWY